MDLAKRIEGTRQFGNEFLTWLLYRSSVKEGQLETALGKMEVWFEDKVRLVSPLAGGEMNILKGESPAEGDEANVALQLGKQLDEARMSINFQGKKWDFQFAAPKFALSAVKVPAVLGETEAENVMERFDLLATLEDIMGSLYHEFLKLRLDDERWPEECRLIGKWVSR